MSDDIAIKVEDVSKTFILPHEKHTSLKSAFVNFYKRGKGYEKQQALKNISFEIKKGEFFGIVGRNGSGKSTLLKLLAGIYAPDKGNITINGKLTPFIELGVGFNPELSGRENVFLNGALLGFNRKEMEAMYDAIVAFAELERFMDQKLKNYSSGMQVRLAFSIAIRANTDILVLDEVLAVGDEAFQRKCSKYFEEIKNNKKTVVLVTHDMGAVRQFCDRAILIKDGDLMIEGSPENIANEYTLENLDTQEVISSSDRSQGTAPVINEFKVELLSPKQLNQDEEVSVKYTIRTAEDIKLNVAMDLQNVDNNAYIFSSSSKLELHKKNKTVEHIVTFNLKNLNDMNIRVNSSLWDADKNTLAYIWNEDAPTFIIRRNDYDEGMRTQFATMFDRGSWVK